METLWWSNRCLLLQSSELLELRLNLQDVRNHARSGLVCLLCISENVERGFAALFLRDRRLVLCMQQPRPSSLLTATAICVPTRLNAVCASNDAFMYIWTCILRYRGSKIPFVSILSAKVALCRHLSVRMELCCDTVSRSLRILCHFVEHLTEVDSLLWQKSLKSGFTGKICLSLICRNIFVRLEYIF